MTLDMLRNAMEQLDGMSEQGHLLYEELTNAASSLVASAAQNFASKTKLVDPNGTKTNEFASALENAAVLQRELQGLVQKPAIAAACDIIKAMLGLPS